jgi:hypothetical protein
LQTIFSLKLPVSDMSTSEPFPINADTIKVCPRNAISDVTFYDTANIVTRIDQTYKTGFPFCYIENNRILEANYLAEFSRHLKEGREVPFRPLGDDWIIIALLFAGFLYSVIRTFSKSLFKDVSRFFLFRGIGEASAHKYDEIFHWQSTLVNLTTFINLALFACCAAVFYDVVPEGVTGFMIWLIALVIIIISITLRHLICTIAGNLSGESEAFAEYMVTVYSSYRYMAIVLFVIVVLFAYSRIFSPKALVYTGFISSGAFYLMRILRLGIIFLKRNISILYLILYLCALEFLPVLIVLKYFTGLF